MCKHILNAQISVRAHCCRKWYDCPQCHAEKENHPIEKRDELILACKKCKKVFRKIASEMEESDEYCPGCDNHFVVDAVEGKAAKKSNPPGAQMVQVEVDPELVDARAKASKNLENMLNM